MGPDPSLTTDSSGKLVPMIDPLLRQRHFHDEKAAYEYVEACVWPEGPVCPHCRTAIRISKMGGRSTRMGTYKCYQCRKPFTVKIGTIFESSHVPLRLWLQAIFLLASSSVHVTANQLQETLGVSLKTASLMSRRIRETNRIATKRKPRPKTKDKAQSWRFIMAAQTLRADETGEAFERRFKLIIRPDQTSARP
jgi:transposase-like protein